MKKLAGVIIFLTSLQAIAYDDFSDVTVSWKIFPAQNTVYCSNGTPKIWRSTENGVKKYSGTALKNRILIAQGDVITVYPKANLDSIYVFVNRCLRGSYRYNDKVKFYEVHAIPVKSINGKRTAKILVDQSTAKCNLGFYLSTNPEDNNNGIENVNFMLNN